MLTLFNTEPRQQPLHLDFIESFLTSHNNRHVGHVNNTQLSSQFQPIYSLAHQRVIGFEALIRPTQANGDVMLPDALFATAQSTEDTVFLDRLCRMLHVSNFMKQADDVSWLFLNINPLVTMYGRQHGAFFGQLLQRYQIPPHRVVIEILEGQIDDEELLAESIRYYKDIGCLIAIDDFGVGHSNFDRIWRIAPHIVKLDRSIIEQAAANQTVRRVLPSLVSLIHEAGSFVLMEGVETEEQALIAMQAEIDFVQGFYFHRPQESLPGFRFHPAIDKLFDQFRQGSQREDISIKQKLSAYTEAFFDVVLKMRAGTAADIALHDFLALADVKRCYFLDERGVQAGANFTSLHASADVDIRFEPLNDVRNAIWARRQYFQRAIAEPGRIHISKPYLSITGGRLCITLSIATREGDKLHVLCGDIDWTDT